MSTFLARIAFGGVLAVAALGGESVSIGALLLNYQFELVDGVVPSQTTPDSSGTFASSATVNALKGYGTNTPGVDYPQLAAGPVANASYAGLNPSSAIQISGGLNANVTGVTIADADAGALDASFSQFSLAVWVKPSSTTNERFIAGKLGTNGNRGWQLSSPSGTNDLRLNYFGTASDGSNRIYVLNNVLPLDTWTHVAFTFDGPAGIDAIYINGVAQSLTNTGASASVPATLNMTNNQPFWVGHRGATGSAVGSWNGYLDDFRIYDHALSTTDVSGFLAPVPEPSGYLMCVFAFMAVVSAKPWRRMTPRATRI